MKIIRPLAAASLTSALVLLSAPAFAHVSVNPSSAEQGSYTKLTFRVPDESETAATTKVQVAFPTEHPITSVRTKSVPGWSAKVQTDAATKAVTQVVWTADKPADGIKPGEFGEFDVSVGPLPKVDSITFRAVQTYSDGTVVRWIEEATDSTEPEKPAPVLSLTPGSGEGHHGAAPSSSATAAAHDENASDGESGTADSAANADTSDGSNESQAPLIISIIALVVAVLGAGLALLRKRPVHD